MSLVDLDFAAAHAAKILATITFHYNPDRLVYLAGVVAALAEFPVKKLDVIILTNSEDKTELSTLVMMCRELLSSPDQSILVVMCQNMAHPFELTWYHKPHIAGKFLSDPVGYTHFIYLEDDVKISFVNFCYFVTYRKFLQEHTLIPSFLRVEFSENHKRHFNTENVRRVNMETVAQKSIIDYGDYQFLNPPIAYIGMFILDVELAKEYLQSPMMDIVQSANLCPETWGLRERASAGLLYVNVPEHFSSRYVVPVLKQNNTPAMLSWIYHLPNTYADNPGASIGKITMSDLFNGH
ncbi:MAG: hypothetical protein H7836_02265 [Magnetococcus sp. YQC-3]